MCGAHHTALVYCREKTESPFLMGWIGIMRGSRAIVETLSPEARIVLSEKLISLADENDSSKDRERSRARIEAAWGHLRAAEAREAEADKSESVEKIRTIKLSFLSVLFSKNRHTYHVRTNKRSPNYPHYAFFRIATKERTAMGSRVTILG
jgi:hypothetical protein